MKAITRCLTLVVVLSGQTTFAQLTISGQLRTRTELRDGQGAPSPRDTAAAFFTSQRTRLIVDYKAHRMKFHTALQDVRVWGQDASTLNRITTDTYDGMMLHEAWGEINLADTGSVLHDLTLKVGRQELVYDDVRLLGNLDWLQQGRRHDAALLKFANNNWTFHVGAGFNQNAERRSNTIFNGVPVGYSAGTNAISTLYKSMQFFYAAKKMTWGTGSFLFFKDDFSKFHYSASDSLKSNPIYDRNTWKRFTTGVHLNGVVLTRLNFTLSAYYQGGNYREGTSLNEYLLSFSTLYAAGKKFSVGPGIDVTSGNDGSQASSKFKRFDPLYGTPHKFWGYMDYFYVADGFGSNGLVDAYLRLRYKAVENLMLSLDAHHFSSPHKITDEGNVELSRRLGTELDVTFVWTTAKSIAIEGGMSSMFGTSTLTSKKVKNVPHADRVSLWAYLMVTLKPEWTAK
jgi:hypothetical protein